MVNKPLLSILIPTVSSRVKTLAKLIDSIEIQIEKHKNEVEIIS